MNYNEVNMYLEIDEQGEALQAVKENNLELVKEIARVVKERNIKHVVVVARGSSNNATTYFKYLLEAYAHIPCGSAAQSIITVYNSYVDYSDTLVVAVSQSGTGVDTNETVVSAKNHGALTVAVTNFPDSLIAKSCDYHLNLSCTEEKSVAATKTFTTEMYILGLLAAYISGDEGLIKDLDSVPSVVKKTLNNKEKIKKIAEFHESLYDAYLLARGFSYVACLESALKLQETCYVKSKPFAISDFYHGPFAVMDETQYAFLLAADGKMNDVNHEMFEKLNGTHANVIVVSNDAYFDDKANMRISIPACAEVVAPFALVVSMQLFACYLSLKKGNNPDHPRSLNKVTITR